MWIVVHFMQDNSVSAVPINWYKDGFCAWPKRTVKNRCNMIEMKTEPTKELFDHFPSRQLSTSPIESYQEALRKAAKSKICSDLSSTEEIQISNKNLRRKRKPQDTGVLIGHKNQSQSIKKKYPIPPVLEASSDSDNDIIDDSDEDKSWTPKKENFHSPNISPIVEMPRSNIKVNPIDEPSANRENLFNDTVDYSDGIITTSKGLADNTSLQSLLQSNLPLHLEHSSHHSIQNLNLNNNKDWDKDFVTFVKTSLTNLKYEIKVLSYTVDSIKTIVQSIEINTSLINSSNTIERNLDIEELKWPITNSTELDDIEKSLTDASIKKNEVALLARLVGKSVSESIRRMMSKLFEDSFLQNYSFLGFKGKNKFYGLNCCQLIFDALRKDKKFIATPDHEISSVTAKWLAQAKNRLNKKNNKVIAIHINESQC